MRRIPSVVIWVSFSWVGLLACSNTGSSSRAAESASVAPKRWREIKETILSRFPSVAQLRTTELEAELSNGAERPLLIDVRAPEEFAVSHLDGARNASGDGLIALLRDEPRDRPIVVYCSVGYRSAQAAEELRKAGFSNVRNYLGSIFEWANRGLPLVDKDGPASTVHPYDSNWGQLLRAPLRAPLRRD